MTPVEQARLRMPPALPMSLAPRDGTPVWVCGVVCSPGVVLGRSGVRTWEKAYYYEGSYFSLAGYRIHNPLGWLPLPEVLTAPVPEPPSQGPDPDCPVCNGTGEVKIKSDKPGQGWEWIDCESCIPHPDNVHPSKPAPERHKPLPHPEDSNG